MNKIIRHQKTPEISRKNSGNQREIQNYINRQEYCIGFTLGMASGPNEKPIVLGGKARKMNGIAVYIPDANKDDIDTFSLMVNEELLISKSIWWAYNPQQARGNSGKCLQYFELPRPLSGSDSVQIIWNAINAHNVFVNFYLVDQPN